jgi:hypothetical protein
MSETVSNPHFLYCHTSIATQTQVYDYLQRALGALEKFYGKKFDREMLVNTIFKYDGTPLKHSYVWCRSVETTNVLLNKTPEGQERCEEVEIEDDDTRMAEQKLHEFMITPYPTGASWVEMVDEEERLFNNTKLNKIKRSLKPVVDFGSIPLSEEQMAQYASQYESIPVKIFPVSVPYRSGYSTNRMFAYHHFRDLDENQIRKHFEKYAVHKKDPHDKKNYPLVFVDRRNSPTYVTVTFHPSSTDGLFAMLMNKKLVMSEKCVLSFELCKN